MIVKQFPEMAGVSKAKWNCLLFFGVACFILTIFESAEGSWRSISTWG